MQFPSRGQASQTKEKLGTVGALLGLEEDDGPAALEAAGGEGQQDGLLVGSCSTLQPRRGVDGAVTQQYKHVHN